MGNVNQFSSSTIANATIVTTAETVVCEVDNVTTGFPGLLIKFAASVMLTLSAATTAVQLRIRKGSVTGTVVADSGDMTDPVTAAALVSYELDGAVQVPEASTKYVLTVELTGASGNSTVRGASIVATVGG